MRQTTRRKFMMQVAAGSSALAATGVMAQATGPKLDEKDPAAVALGYTVDTTKADQKKFPKHTAEQKCGNCQLFVGKASDAAGACPLFAGKQIASSGWCSAWVKKAG